MEELERITFGGSGLDRAAHLRAAPDRIAALWADPEARVLPLWKAKPLIGGASRDAAGWLPTATAGLEGTFEPPIFLGLDTAGPRFALDLSDWVPPEPPDGPLDGFMDATEQVHPQFPADTRFVELRACMTRLGARDAELAATARALASWHGRHRFCANCGAATAMSQAGWQRDCAACGTSHYPRTDPVAIMLVTRGNSVLVGRSPGWPRRMYSLLAGFVEPGETVEAAVRREVFEEAGITVGRVGYLLSQPWPFPASLMLGCWGEALSDRITVDPVELEHARWVTREEMMQVFAGEHPEMTAARHGAIARHVIGLWLADRLDSPGAG